ncbi:hypothetical protein NDU88_001328 [Pleurodeles waltl]|uniref:Uncharacterized protein n=1 Tax=Pleurodeles waltl TaxID=8319 RepID=A0AAV7U668_PLEWA|nr:hypothetical protein NDU88_001328 [Pleurodeles waltl]
MSELTQLSLFAGSTELSEQLSGGGLWEDARKGRRAQSRYRALVQQGCRLTDTLYKSRPNGRRGLLIAAIAPDLVHGREGPTKSLPKRNNTAKYIILGLLDGCGSRVVVGCQGPGGGREGGRLGKWRSPAEVQVYTTT